MKHFVENRTTSLGLTEDNRFSREVLNSQIVLWIDSLDTGARKFRFRRVKFVYPQRVLLSAMSKDDDTKPSGEIFEPCFEDKTTRDDRVRKDIVKGSATGTLILKKIKKTSPSDTDHYSIRYTTIEGKGRQIPELGDEATLCLGEKSVITIFPLPVDRSHGRWCKIRTIY